MKAWSFLAALAALTVVASGAQAEVLDKTGTFNGVAVQYQVVLPQGYDPAKAYPAVLAFPPGGQTWELTQRMTEAIWKSPAEKRGYIVIQPAAPGGQALFEGGAKIFPAFITKMLAEYKVKDGKFHAAGPSNGGVTAFYVAAKFPQYFYSVTGFPGLLDATAPEAMKGFKQMCVHMFSGENDQAWTDGLKEQSAILKTAGVKVSFSIEAGQSHFMQSLTGEGANRLFDQFDQDRMGSCAK